MTLTTDAGARWEEEAACRGLDPHLFFPERGQSVDQPLRVCRRCPVRPACLAYALSLGDDPQGIWGGTTPRQRRRMRREGRS